MRLAVALVAVLALGGCNDQERVVGGGPGGTSLRIKVYPRGPDAGTVKARTVTCPGSARACGQLRAADLAPLPAGTACTKIYGGPAEATVKGSLDGRGINARFTLSGGCEIDRWRQAAYLLGDPPGQ